MPDQITEGVLKLQSYFKTSNQYLVRALPNSLGHSKGLSPNG